MRWNTLYALFWKDIHKVWRKPLTYIINICIPLFMTAVVGFVFSPSGGNSNALGVMKMAIVDEDDSIVGEILSGAVTNPNMQENMNLQFMDRETAMETILDNKISGILIIPKNFSDQYLLGENVPPLKLIKNPAHRYHPAVLEELLGVVAEGANAVYRVAGDDLIDLRDVFEEEGIPDMARIAGLAIRMGDRFEIAGDLLFPPLVQYNTEESKPGEEEEGSSFNIFGFILPGFAGLFLFFIADNVIRDIYREEKAGTLDRYRSFQGSLVPFMVSKVLLSMLVIAVSILVTFGAGMLLFGIGFSGLMMMFLYTVVYSFFVTGFIVFINAMAGKETRADTMNGVVIFCISFLGGNMVPANQMPAFITDNISSYLPNYWFIRGMHHLQFGWGDVTIVGYSMLMLALGFLFLYLGSRILYLKLEGRRL